MIGLLEMIIGKFEFIVILVLLVIATGIAALSRSLLKSVVALGISSFLLAILFFMYQASIAALFEFSVGAGLMSVIMLVAISLVDKIREEGHEEKKHSD